MTGSTYGTAPATTAAPIVINQHFKAPTPDRIREARLALFAHRAAFSG